MTALFTQSALGAILSSMAFALNGGKIAIYSGSLPVTADAGLSSNILLAEIGFGSPAFGPAAVSGNLLFLPANSLAKDISANTTGTATFFRALSAGGGIVFQGDVGEAGSGAFLILNSVNIVAGGEVDVTSLTIGAHLTPTDTASSRFDVASVPSLIAVWDASLDSARTPTSNTAVTSIAPRAGSGGLLVAAAAGGGSVVAVLGERDYLQMTGGNNQRRLNAGAGIADNLFSGGGMIVIAARAEAAAAGVLISKWANTGWILYASSSSQLSLEVYASENDSCSYQFTIPRSEWMVLELEWDSDQANTAPVVRVNGQLTTVTKSFATSGTTVSDVAGVLSIGNRDWGTLSTPWAGDIGEILLLSDTPTASQKTAIRTDMAQHWSATLAPVGPVTYYVATTGADTNPGTTTLPWRTIGHAVNRPFNPGSQVVVRPGTYTEVVTISNGGTTEGDVTIKSETKGQALIRPPAGTYSTVMLRANHVVIDGFDIQGGDGHAIDAESVQYTKVSNNTLHDSGGSGVQYNYSEFIEISGNIAHTNASTNGFHCSGISIYQSRNITGDTSTAGFRTIVRNNICYDNITGPVVAGEHTDGNGIIIDDFQSTQNINFTNYTYPTLVENNLCYGNGSKGIQVTWSDNVTVRNNTVWHNNIDNLNTGTWRGELNHQQSSGCTWLNNIAVSDPTVNVNNSAIGSFSYNGYVNTGSSWHNNLTFNGTNGQSSVNLEGSGPSITSATSNILGANPLFVASGSDFRLQAGSPAIGAGTSAFGVAELDLAGNPRVVGTIDIGAHEKQS